ncbi:MAG TPA: hypothetical protein VGG92_11490 [Caulobacteraceae bacterium]
MWRITSLALALAMCLAASARAQDGFAVQSPSDLAKRLSYVAPAPFQYDSASTALGRMTASEARAKGLADAPALVKTARIDCQLADARFIGEAANARSKSKEDFYEVACAASEGFIIAKTSPTEVSAATCLEMSQPIGHRKPNPLQCSLPGNVESKLGLLPYISEARTDCTPSEARFIGYNATQTVFEVACRGGAGYILITAAPPRLDGSAEAEPCIAMPANGALECKLTTSKDEVAVVDQLVVKSGKICEIKSRAYLGSSMKDGATFYEFACSSGRGYVVEQARDGNLAGVTDCAKADHIVQGGCKLTSTSKAQALQAVAYSQLAKAAKFDCDVSEYAFLPSAAGGDVVELACSNRPDGGIGLFSASGADQVIDCAYARFFGYRCILSNISGANAALSADLKTLGEGNCAVTDARPMGITAERHGFTEVSCAGHLKGYVIEYNLRPVTPISVMSCAAAIRIGSGCRLPGNVE